MTDWLDDKRAIQRLCIGDQVFDWGTSDRFERIEQPGEHCMIPWVRIVTYYRNNVMSNSARTLEVPLNKLEWIEYGDAA